MSAVHGGAEALAQRLLGELQSRANPENVAGMGRFGISTLGTLGVTMPEVRGLARDAKRELGRDPELNHQLAAILWGSGVHEARIMATVIDAPSLVTRAQAESWVLDVDSWDTCDQLCGNLLWQSIFAWELPPDWAVRNETFVKRAGFVVAAQLAVKDKPAEDSAFEPLLRLIELQAPDERNDVKKGVNWALRQIGKRSSRCNAKAIVTAEKILDSVPARGGTPDEAAARWIARDALRELRSAAVRERLGLS
ncbi:MAG TPA: DNA alkylation repair protein [Coriobacteriia bacterium]|nr:DNA alkylation repair protein [Coriobacteriia bacterium]